MSFLERVQHLTSSRGPLFQDRLQRRALKGRILIDLLAQGGPLSVGIELMKFRCRRDGAPIVVFEDRMFPKLHSHTSHLFLGRVGCSVSCNT